MPVPIRRVASPRVSLALGILFVLVGAGLLYLAGTKYFGQRAFLARAEHTTGTIISFIKSTRTGGTFRNRQTEFYAPVFSFTDRAGSIRHATSRLANADKPGYSVGQSVPVLYNPDNPAEAELDLFFASWGLAAILGGVGALGFALGAAVVWTALAARRRAKRGVWTGRVSGRS